MSSFSTWMSALTSRTWSCDIFPGTNFMGPPSMFWKRPSYQSSQWCGFWARISTALSARSRVARGQVEVAPVDPAPHFVDGRIPGMMGIGEAHPAEPVVGRVERVQPGDGAIGDPVGVVHPAGHGIVLDLGGVGVPAPLVVEAHAGEVDERVDRHRATAGRWLRAICRSATAAGSRAWPARRGRSRGTARSSPPWPGSSRSTSRRGRSRVGNGPCRPGRCGSPRCRGGARRPRVRRPAAGHRWR